MTLRHNVERDVVFAAVADERRQIASLIDGLDDAQLATPSLCAGWDVKTVAAHVLSTVIDGLPAFLRLAARRASLARAIDELARQRALMTAAQIATSLRQCADRPIDPPVFGPLDPLADVLVHGGDIKIPLGLPFSPYPERAELALDFLSGPWRFGFVPRGRLRAICLRATDVDRTWGAGEQIRGPAASLMMAACGRVETLNALDGPGLALLRRRLSG